jgi:DNA-binding NarL/FixJ family response regulator
MNVLLVDDHPMLREALRAALQAMEGDLEVVGEAATAREAVALCESLRPDLVVMDILLPGSNGVAAMRDLRRLGVDCRIVVYTAVDAASLAKDALGVGATAYVLKTASADDFEKAIECVRRGGTYVTPSLARQLDEVPSAGDRAAGLASLSAREREVFDLVARGNSTATIATSLFISVKTVETHRSRINRKLGLHSTAEIIRFAARHGLLTD